MSRELSTAGTPQGRGEVLADCWSVTLRVEAFGTVAVKIIWRKSFSAIWHSPTWSRTKNKKPPPSGRGGERLARLSPADELQHRDDDVAGAFILVGCGGGDQKFVRPGGQLFRSGRRRGGWGNRRGRRGPKACTRLGGATGVQWVPLCEAD